MDRAAWAEPGSCSRQTGCPRPRGGLPWAPGDAPGESQLPAPGACRVSVPCLAIAGSVQAPGIGGNAPAAALLASDDRGACPAELYPLAARAGASDVPRADNQGKAVACHDGADSDSQRKPQVHQPDQGVRDAICIPALVTCPGPQHCPDLVLSQRGFQVPSLTARDTSSTASTGRLATGGAIGSGTRAPPFVFWRFPPWRGMAFSPLR